MIVSVALGVVVLVAVVHPDDGDFIGLFSVVRGESTFPSRIPRDCRTKAWYYQIYMARSEDRIKAYALRRLGRSIKCATKSAINT